jgi:hypothetical protein
LRKMSLKVTENDYINFDHSFSSLSANQLHHASHSSSINRSAISFKCVSSLIINHCQEMMTSTSDQNMIFVASHEQIAHELVISSLLFSSETARSVEAKHWLL